MLPWALTLYRFRFRSMGLGELDLDRDSLAFTHPSRFRALQSCRLQPLCCPHANAGIATSLRAPCAPWRRRTSSRSARLRVFAPPPPSSTCHSPPPRVPSYPRLFLLLNRLLSCPLPPSSSEPPRIYPSSSMSISLCICPPFSVLPLASRVPLPSICSCTHIPLPLRAPIAGPRAARPFAHSVGPPPSFPSRPPSSISFRTFLSFSPRSSRCPPSCIQARALARPYTRPPPPLSLISPSRRRHGFLILPSSLYSPSSYPIILCRPSFFVLSIPIPSLIVSRASLSYLPSIHPHPHLLRLFVLLSVP
ncbi:hypothetical protein C8R44DRAFT_166852 [Mycena epipterygia]|nr:hypothetical protein C8R44DRAFT_166852 [Mycena epipterygia]